MTYSMTDLLRGAQTMAASVFGRRSEYNLQFNHEDDGCWYVDFPGWPFDHGNLQMVAGADRLCDCLSDDGNFAYINVVPSNRPLDMPGYACLVQGEHSLTGGSVYLVNNLPEVGEKQIWLCPVTLFVLGQYPKYIYIKKNTKSE